MTLGHWTPIPCPSNECWGGSYGLIDPDGSFHCCECGTAIARDTLDAFLSQQIEEHQKEAERLLKWLAEHRAERATVTT